MSDIWDKKAEQDKADHYAEVEAMEKLKPYTDKLEAIKQEVSGWCEHCMESCDDSMLGKIKKILEEK